MIQIVYLLTSAALSWLLILVAHCMMGSLSQGVGRTTVCDNCMDPLRASRWPSDNGAKHVPEENGR